MTLQEYGAAVVQFVQSNQAWAPPMVFALAFGESLAFFSLLLPATVILVGISGLIGASGIDFWPVLLAGWAGSVLGYGASYWCGVYFKDSIHLMWPLNKHPEAIQRGQLLFDRWGAYGVFLGHFFGPMRAVVPVVAGMYGMSQLKFQAASISSSLIWAIAVLAPGAFGGNWLFG